MIYLLKNVAKTQDVPLDGTIFSGKTGQKDRATFMNKNIPIQLPSSSTTPFNNKKPRYDINLLTNVANAQDVPLDGTIFFGNTGQKDKATFMNKKVPIELS